MINPLKAAKAVSLMQKFQKNHPKVSAFLSYEFRGGLPEGTVLELTVTKPGEKSQVTNMRVTADDLELLREIRDMK
jgi:hypothetical protein